MIISGVRLLRPDCPCHIIRLCLLQDFMQLSIELKNVHLVPQEARSIKNTVLRKFWLVDMLQTVIYLLQKYYYSSFFLL